MLLKDSLPIGVITKSHGVKGAVQLEVSFSGKVFERFATLLIMFDKKLVPFFIEEWQGSEHNPIIKFEDIDNPEEAKTLTGHAVYVAKKWLSPDEMTLHTPEEEFLAFQVKDQDGKVIGNVIRMDELPDQTLLIVDVNGREVPLPFHHDLILEEDSKAKILIMDIPEGLLDIYLN